jgi:plastocyanin
VKLATQSDLGWDVTDVADTDVPAMGPEELPILEPTTGVAVDGDGVLYVTYTDQGSVSLVSSTDGGDFAPVDAVDTRQGEFPSVAVSPDGANVYLAWYGTVGQDLRLGVWGDVQDLQVAAPSPTPEVDAGPAPAEGCGDSGQVALDIVGVGIAFDTDCLVAPASDKFTIHFDNQDDGIPHNIDVFTEQGGESINSTDLTPGPVEETLNMDPLDVGTYYFQCDAHPTTMFGALAVVKGAK